jgi:hypothetical protein
VLQVQYAEVAVARPPQPEGPHALGEGALHAGAGGVGGGERVGRLAPPGGLDRLVLRPEVEREGAGPRPPGWPRSASRPASESAWCTTAPTR